MFGFEVALAELITLNWIQVTVGAIITVIVEAEDVIAPIPVHLTKDWKELVIHSLFQVR